MDINLVLVLFAGAVVLMSAFSSALQRRSLPGPLLALAFGVVLGPHGLHVMRIEDFGPPPGELLEQAARITLGIGLAGVALRLPHGYWRRRVRWNVVAIGLGMGLMLLIATGILWIALGIPFVLALLIGAILTPTDPVVTTPIVTGSLAEQRIPERVRHDLSAESGLNDGLAYLFVMLPILLTTSEATAWQELLTRVLLWQVLGAIAIGAVVGLALGWLFVLARRHDLMEESSYLGFVVPLGLAVLGLSKLVGTDGVLAVFVAAAVFGQIIPQRDESEEGKIDDAVNRLVLLPVFILLGIALPIGEWVALGWVAPLVLLAAILLRRLLALWALRPLLRRTHARPELLFMSWFGAVGVSALLYATLAERLTGMREPFVYATLAITLSVVVHGLTTAPFGAWLQRSVERPGPPDS